MTEALTICIYGDSKQGKSWLAETGPGPVLKLDTEGRARLTPGGRDGILWDPRTPLPASYPDGSPITTATVVSVNVPDFETFKLVYSVLASGNHYFRTVDIDGITELQQRLIDKNVGTSQMRTQDWGDVLRELEAVVRQYRDLRQHPTKPIDVFVCTAGEHEKNGKMKPLLQGGLSNKLSYHFDVVGYLHHVPDGAGGAVRILDISPLGLFTAGSNWDALTEWYPNGRIVVPHKTEGRRLLEELHTVINQGVSS